MQVDRYVPGIGPLDQDAETWTGHLGVSFNRDVAKWRLALTGNYDHADTRNDNDVGLDTTALQAAITAGTVNPFGTLPANLLTPRPGDDSHSKSDTGNIQFVASGPIWTIPAGEIRTSFRLGATGSAFSSQSSIGGIGQSETFSQGGGNVQASIDLPITSAKNKILPMFGDITVNTHVAFQEVSGFSVLDTLGYGVHWVPITGLSILINRLHDQAAPTQQQTSAPILLTPNTRIFDFATGQTVDVTQITGGNPALTSDDRYRDSVRVTWQPYEDKQLIFRADYNKIHYKNPIVGALPAATAAIEAAFPDRFIRDAEGDLTEVDYRPVNFTAQDVSEYFRFGLRLISRPIGPARPRRRRRATRCSSSCARPASPARSAAARPARRPARPPRACRRPFPARRAPSPPSAGAPSDAGAAPGNRRPAQPDRLRAAVVTAAPAAAALAAWTRRWRRTGRQRGFAGGRGGRGGGRGGPQDGRFRISRSSTPTTSPTATWWRPAGGRCSTSWTAPRWAGAGGQPQPRRSSCRSMSPSAATAPNSTPTGRAPPRSPAAWPAPTKTLSFSDLVKVNARLFADLNQRKTLIEQHPILKGVRISFSVANLFDQRQKVVDSTGSRR